MLPDFKVSPRNSGKSSSLEEIENTPINTNRIEDKGLGLKGTKFCKTPTKPRKSRCSDALKPLKTPEKQGGSAQKNVFSSNISEMGVDLSKYHRNGNGGFANVTTPISSRVTEKGSSSILECNSTKMTPTRSVIKPPNPRLCLTGAGTRAVSASGGARMAHFEALCKGVPVSSSSSTVVNTVEVPHFAMKEDPSFWMDHNVQVLIRIRPLNGMEKSVSGYARCLKQESEQCITWIGQPETRFTFDHVACETLDQETLFRTVGLPMVENCLRGYNSCIFAYGQTGSGKTYTMLGNINNLGNKPSPDCGMTSRIFEYLFTRIRAEEESRDGRLSYSCKCSFLEIYNEQITDLLDPSSTNLLLREDIKTGVYVENLSESEVHTVGDILKLLSQGSSNRKVAATNMNRESSRSHSVFTCVIESRWEKHSTTNIRFARLNLVDLAGSERQKTSGAEGERLKEAANINKSLSTLGYVIMVLVDAAHAKTKHVPYRDSRLTFLLQDSLGGNSKTMIIANVSPSICCAAETLNTLKFAQRAKLIQNNAVVNEDPPEDVTALQYQIHLLKEELLLLKPKKVSRSLTFHTTFVEDTRQEHNIASKIKVLANTGVSSNSASNVESPSLKEQLHNAVQPENGDMHETLIKRTQEVVDLQLELDILRIMLKEERSFRIDLENRALCLTRDIELAEGKVSQLTKRYEDMNEELSEAKSLSEVLKSQHLVSLREMEDLRNSSNHYVDLLRKQEHEISLLKERASDKKLSYPSSDKLSTIEESISQINPKKTHHSLEKMKRPNTRYQSGLASHASNENEIDEVHRQDEAKIAEMIVCLQEQLGVLQHQVQWSDQQETETKGRLMFLQTELKELQENFELVTRNNKSLVEKLDEKNKQLKALSEEWKSVTTEIEVVLAGGQEALEDASNHVGAISGSLPQKRKWISEELSRMTRSIFEKEFMIKKLTNYLEDATTRKSDMESMIRSLRGAALAITEEHQQDCSEKEKEIINLTSQLSEKTLIIAELENKMKRDDEQLRNASKCATVGFIVVSRLSEINFDYLNSLKHKDIQLMESIGINMQKDILPYNQVEENVEEEKQTCSLRTEIEVALLQLSELKKHISYLEQKLNETEEIKVPEAKEILADLKDGISTLQSWLKDRDDVLGYSEEQFLPDLSAKEFEFLVLASELEQMAVEKFRLQKEKIGFANALEKLKEDVVFQSVDAELKKWILLDKEVEVTHLENEIEAAKTELNVIISEMKKANKAFEQDLILLNDVTCSNGAFKKELQEVTEANMRLSSEIIKLKLEYEKSLEDIQVSFNVKGKRLEEARQCIQILEQEIAAKDKEICQQKAHISELYPHSEAQACEYKQKIKAIQPEGPASHIRNSPIFKLQKNDSRKRDSDSPLKCTGLELVNLEPERRDKQTTGRPHIIELENLAANEIFMLSSRLATAKNIAHDVSRDLLELKSTISAYVSTLDEHQVIK